MAFSFRVGTNWCHDFPKLAKESGFYFNMHRSRVRVDWNRISSIDIDRVIKERDFVTVDENVNNVIDYSLESEYDTKILDSAFVKLFRLAQLAVEYLLYCKQYLDQSVVILKDEIRSKIEDNIKLRKEITALEEIIKHLKDKAKEKSKLIETKLVDSTGEIHKCPYCAKTFLSTMFVTAHIARRHPYTVDTSSVVSPVHEHYRAETEKLHNEIKMLKERLNETERVIRNESEKITNTPTDNVDSKKYQHERGDFRKYQEEINDLKSILFDEIRNIRHRERSPIKIYENSSETNLRLLISHQEKEIERLKNQLLERLTPDIENMHAKLQTQESLWKSKIERMEQQHRADIEKITSELKSTQEASELMKTEYESKVSVLERRSEDQSNLLTSLSREVNDTQIQSEMKKYSENNKNKEIEGMLIYKGSNFSDSKRTNGIKENKLVIEDVNSTSNDSTKNDLVTIAPKIIKNSYTSTHKVVDTRNVPNTIDKQLVNTTNKKSMHINEDSTSSNNSVFKVPQIKDKTERTRKMRFMKEQSRNQPFLNNPQIHNNSESKNISIKSNVKEIDSNVGKTHVSAIHERDRKLSETLSEASSEMLSSYSTECGTESDSEILSLRKDENQLKCNINRDKKSISSLQKLQEKKKTTNTPINNLAVFKEIVLEKFEKKLRDLGIDPEWTGIPYASYEQKIKMIEHHQNIDSKKILKYNQIKKKIIEEVLHRLLINDKAKHQLKLVKQSSLDKLVTNVKSKAMKALNIPKTLYVSPKKVDIKSESEISKDSDALDISQDKKNCLVVQKEIERSDSVKTSPGILTYPERFDYKESLKERSSKRFSTTSVKSYKSQRNEINVDSIIPVERYKTSTPKEKSIVPGFSKAGKSSSFSILQEVQDPIISPKNNKSVLKSTSGSVGSLVKKKVFFDLTDKEEREPLYSSENNELTDNNWNISSISDKKEQVLQKERSISADNIVLKTNQAAKIAEISKKIEQQLSIPRRKPSGAIETMLSSAYVQKNNSKEGDNSNAQFSDLSITEISIQQLPKNGKSPSTKLSKASPQDIKKSIESQSLSSIINDTDLDTDIEDILRVE